MATKGKERTFRVKYDRWPVRDAAVPVSALEGLNQEEVARRVMPAAFSQQKDKMGGDRWTDAPDRKIILVKASEGIWEGERVRDNGTKEEWVIMETTAQ